MKDRYDDIDEYIRDVQAEIEQNDQCAIHYYNLGMALLTKKDFVDAEEAFLNAVRNSAHMAEAYVQLGGICMQRGDLEGCLRYNHEAANCRAQYAIPWSNIGFVHLQRGEVKEAVKALDKALKWDPDLLQARTSLASACIMQGEYDSAIEQCDYVIKKEADFGPAWHNKSLALCEKGDYQQAINCADKAMDCGYDVPEAYLMDLADHLKAQKN